MNVLEWLTGPDSKQPGVRYFALRDLLDRPPDDTDLVAARASIMESGPVPAILAAQQPDGYWEQPGPGYTTKYRGTVWQIIQLHEYGANGDDSRVRAGCDYVLAHSRAPEGGFGASGNPKLDRPPAGSVIHCLNGNLLQALIGLGRLHDSGVQEAFAWLVPAITGSDPSFHYGAFSTRGPGFACRVNSDLPCAWGAAKALKALLAVPEAERDADMRRAIEIGAGLLLSRDPAVADYPNKSKISEHWFEPSFPSSYWSDIIEVVEILAGLGHGGDPRLRAAIDWILARRDQSGRWSLDKRLSGKLWAAAEPPGKPSKWLTLRALRTLRTAGVPLSDLAGS